MRFLQRARLQAAPTVRCSPVIYRPSYQRLNRADAVRRPSREAAKECSPRRKAWVTKGGRAQSSEGAKETYRMDSGGRHTLSQHSGDL